MENFSVRGGSLTIPQGIAITLNNVRRAVIRFVDLADLVGGIYLYECEDVVIEDVRC